MKSASTIKKQIVRSEKKIAKLVESAPQFQHYLVAAEISVIENENRAVEIYNENRAVEIYSVTGQCNGQGSDRWKNVTWMNDWERRAARVGITVYVNSNTNYLGVTTKRVEYSNGYYNHRQLSENVDTSKMVQLA